MTERKYALTKVSPGDWLLPSNSAKTLWRIAMGDELSGEGGLESYVSVWQLWRWTGRIEDRYAIAESLADRDWGQWELCASFCRTRQEAINEALRLGG